MNGSSGLRWLGYIFGLLGVLAAFGFTVLGDGPYGFILTASAVLTATLASG